MLAKPGLLKPTKKFEASIYALTKEEGGRHTPFFTNYRPQFFFRTADVTASVRVGSAWPRGGPCGMGWYASFAPPADRLPCSACPSLARR